MKFSTVIFDLDGTLLDTLEDLADSVNELLGECGLPLRSLGEIRSFIGNGERNLISLSTGIADGYELDGMVARYREIYAKNRTNKTRPYDGIIEMLEQLKRLGIKTAVVSNKRDQDVRQIVGALFDGLIEYAAGEREGIPRKPDPAGLYAAMKALGSKSGETMYVGDSDVDILTAKNAGIASVGCAGRDYSWGFRDRESLEAAGADHIVEAPCEILDLLR